jgi:hypothetical protein
MINLIPPTAKRAMRREYWQRVVFVWLILLSGVLLLIGVLTAPSFVLVQSQLQAYELQLQSATAVASSQDELTDVITTTNTQTQIAYAAGELPNISQYIQAVTDLVGTEVTLSQFDVQRDGSLVPEIVVSGIATSRVGLTQFSERIEADPIFTEANIPLENLAANENIPFTLRIVINTDM